MNTSKYKPEYCAMVIDHMKEGNSFESFGLICDASKETMYQWVKKHPEFKEAKNTAFIAAQKWFEDKLKKKLDENDRLAKNIDTTCLIFALKTRFHETYGDKKDVQHTGEISINIDKDDLEL